MGLQCRLDRLGARSRFVFALSLSFVAVFLAPVASVADVSISVNLAPPAFPVYEQPPAPGPNYAWTPGYWAYDDVDGYYWVPGTWALAPTPGYLWTPCYWGWSDGQYRYHDGYWGAHVGFYGGVNYGFGYGGGGYNGGGWNNGVFVNRSFSNTTNVANVTNNTTINNTAVSHASFNGGPGGTTATPTPAEQAAAQEPHVPPTSEQKAHVQAARQNPAFRASVNHGKPAIAATSKPGVFTGKGVVAAKQGGVAAPARAARPQPTSAGARPQARPAQAKPQAAPRAAAKKPAAPPRPKPKNNPRPKPKPRP